MHTTVKLRGMTALLCSVLFCTIGAHRHSTAFETLAGCVTNTRYDSKHTLDTVQETSTISCASACARSSGCQAFNVKQQSSDDTGVDCELLADATVSCAGLQSDNSYQYFRRILPCKKCSATNQCTGKWMKAYELDEQGNTVAGSKAILKDALARGSAVHITFHQQGSLYWFKPVVYNYNDDDLLFQMSNPPASNSQVEVSLQFSTRGTLSGRLIFPSPGQFQKVPFKENQPLAFFVEDKSCDSLLYNNLHPGSYSPTDLFLCANLGHILMARRKAYGETKVLAEHVVISSVRNGSPQLAFLQNQGLRPNFLNEDQIHYPLTKEYEITDIKGNQQTWAYDYVAMNGVEVIAEGVEVEWHFDPCWKLVAEVDPDGNPVSPYDLEGLENALRGGHRIRVMFTTGNITVTYNTDYAECREADPCMTLSMGSVNRFDEDPFQIQAQNGSVYQEVIQTSLQVVTVTLMHVYPWDITTHTASVKWYRDIYKWMVVLEVNHNSGATDTSPLREAIQNGRALRLEYSVNTNIYFYEVHLATLLDSNSIKRITDYILQSPATDESCSAALGTKYALSLETEPLKLLRSSWSIDRSMACNELVLDLTNSHVKVYASG